MPLVKRSAYDMLHLHKFTDVMVNPVNLYGVMGNGLAKAFADEFPAMLDSYKAMCRDETGEAGKGQLQIGSLHIFNNAETKNIIINLPTKRHWMDKSSLDDVEAGCAKLALYLQQHPFYTVAMPILGAGLGKLDVDMVYPVIAKHLDPLPNIIHLCMRPDRFEHPPLYLAIVGSRAYKDFDKIDLGVMDGLIEFGKTYNDFEAAISGGADGVDRVGCGRGILGDKTPNIAMLHGMRAIVCHADWDRYGNSAGFIRNRTVADIATHVVAFIGSRSVGTRGMIDLINRHNEKVDKLETGETQQADMFSSVMPKDILVKKHLFTIDISSVCV